MLFGADQALTNDQILRADNAAVALRLLGQDDRLVWYVPSHRRPRRRRRRQPADPAAALGPAGAGARRGRHGHRDPVAGPTARRRWPPSRCRSSCAPSRPRAAWAGSTAARATAATPRSSLRRAARTRLRRAAAARLHRRLRTSVVREVARRTGRSRGRRRGAARPGRRRTVLGPRPDHPGQAAGRARQRGTPYMTENTRAPETVGTGPPASGSPRCAPRSARPWSARTPRCPGCSSRCCAAATC